MALNEHVLEAIDRVTPLELAETRRWCELGDRVHLLSELTEGRIQGTAPQGGERTRERTQYMREYVRRRYREDSEFRRQRRARSAAWRKENADRVREYNREYHRQRYHQDAEFRERRRKYLQEYRRAAKRQD